MPLTCITSLITHQFPLAKVKRLMHCAFVCWPSQLTLCLRDRLRILGTAMSSTPFIRVGSTILVTGVNGFLGAHVALELLQAGYKVKGVVRSQAKGEALVRLLPPNLQSSISFVYVADIGRPGAYEAANAFDGVSAVCHLASPLPDSTSQSEDIVKEMLEPAVRGTLNILRDASMAPSVLRAITTSSLAAARDVANPTATLTEDSWNPITWDEAATTTKVFVAYMASKALSERAAWEYHSEAKAQYDLVTICPAFLFGPPVGGQVAAVKDVPSTLTLFFGALTGTGGVAGGPTGSSNYIDVRDLAHAYVLALQCEAAGNERFLLTGGVFVNAEVAELNSHLKGRVEWSPRKDTVDCSKARRLLGFRPRDKQITLRDTAAVLLPLVPSA